MVVLPLDPAQVVVDWDWTAPILISAGIDPDGRAVDPRRRGGARRVRFPLAIGHPESRQWSGEGCPGTPSIDVSEQLRRDGVERVRSSGLWIVFWTGPMLLVIEPPTIISGAHTVSAIHLDQRPATGPA
jgi:hypothetical protein